jgi:hypothetical protein
VDVPAVRTRIADKREIASVRLSVAGLLQAAGLCAAAERETLAALCQCASHHENTPDITYAVLREALARLDLCGRARQRASLLNAYMALLPYPNEYLRDCVSPGPETSRHREICGLG